MSLEFNNTGIQQIFKPEPIKTRPLLNIEIFLLKYFMYSVYLLDAQERREKNVPINFFKKISHDNTIERYLNTCFYIYIISVLIK